MINRCLGCGIPLIHTSYFCSSCSLEYHDLKELAEKEVETEIENESINASGKLLELFHYMGTKP